MILFRFINNVLTDITGKEMGLDLINTLYCRVLITSENLKPENNLVEIYLEFYGTPGGEFSEKERLLSAMTKRQCKTLVIETLKDQTVYQSDKPENLVDFIIKNV